MRPIAEAYKDFPILHKEHNGHRVIYLDSGATAQIPQSVICLLYTSPSPRDTR